MYPGLLRNARAFAAAALTVAVGIVAVELATQSTLSATSTASWEQEDFLATERDDHGRLMAEVNAIADLEPRQAGAVFIVGGSTVREGLVPDPVIQDAVDGVLGADAPAIHTLYSFDQSLAETARIVTNLPLSEGDTVVLGINPRRFGFGPEALDNEVAKSRISLLDRSGLEEIIEDPAVDAAIDDSGNRLDRASSSMLFSPWDKLAVFEHRLFLRNQFQGRLAADTSNAWGDLTTLRLSDVAWTSLFDLERRDIRRPIRYGFGATPLPDADKAEIAIDVATVRVPAYFEHSDVDFAVLAALAEHVHSSGADLVFLELPRAGASTDAYGAVWDDYDGRVDALASESGAERLDLRSLEFDDDEFFDLEHLLAAARPRLTDIVIESLLGIDPGLEL